jgi:hypothetical protein
VDGIDLSLHAQISKACDADDWLARRKRPMKDAFKVADSRFKPFSLETRHACRSKFHFFAFFLQNEMSLNPLPRQAFFQLFVDRCYVSRTRERSLFICMYRESNNIMSENVCRLYVWDEHVTRIISSRKSPSGPGSLWIWW